MGEDADFFMSAAGESMKLAEPRTCWKIARMSDSLRDDYMLVSIEPPFQEPKGIGYRDVYKIIIATRFKNRSLYPITSWPCHVSVFRILNENIERGSDFKPGDVRLFTWAMLFRTIDDAERHYQGFL